MPHPFIPPHSIGICLLLLSGCVLTADGGEERTHDPSAIGINFTGGEGWWDTVSLKERAPPRPIRTDQFAGLVSQRNWNNAASSIHSDAFGAAMSIVDSIGTVTGVKLTYHAVGTYNVGYSSRKEGNYTLIDGYLDTNEDTPTKIELSGVPYRDYFVVVYHLGGTRGNLRRATYTVTDGGGLDRSSISNDRGSLGFTGDFDTSPASYSVFGMIRGEASLTIEGKGLSASGVSLRAPINAVQIIDVSHRIDLSDIVGGGNGFGTGIARGLLATVGEKRVTLDGRQGGSSSFPERIELPDEPLIDSIFVPGEGEQPITADGHMFSFKGSDDDPSMAIFNGSEGVGDPNHEGNSGLLFEQVIGFGSQHGITFDLDAIRASDEVGELTAFTAIACENRNTLGGSVGCWALIDGEKTFHEAVLTDGERHIYFDLPRDSKFLTLTITGDADGLGFFANPYLLYSPTAPIVNPMPIAGENFLKAITAIVLVGSLAFTVMWMLSRVRVRKLKQQQAIEAERRRIARDMHDEAGAQLARIAILSQMAGASGTSAERQSELVDSIQAASKVAVRRFDQIVWAVNPANDTLHGFIDYLVAYTNNYFDGTNLVCQLKIPQEIPQMSLNAALRQNLLRICEEALSNCLQHSEADRVFVELSLLDNELLVRIEDDGRGISPNSQAPDSDGLRNMEERITSISGRISVESTLEKGTVLLIGIRLDKLA